MKCSMQRRFLTFCLGLTFVDDWAFIFAPISCVYWCLCAIVIIIFLLNVSISIQEKLYLQIFLLLLITSSPVSTSWVVAPKSHHLNSIGSLSHRREFHRLQAASPCNSMRSELRKRRVLLLAFHCLNTVNFVGFCLTNAQHLYSSGHVRIQREWTKNGDN